MLLYCVVNIAACYKAAYLLNQHIRFYPVLYCLSFGLCVSSPYTLMSQCIKVSQTKFAEEERHTQVCRLLWLLACESVVSWTFHTLPFTHDGITGCSWQPCFSIFTSLGAGFVPSSSAAAGFFLQHLSPSITPLCSAHVSVQSSCSLHVGAE